MDNGIISRQNLAGNISLLAAQRSLYSRAKKLAGVQAFVAGITPVVGAIAVAINPSVDVWAAFVGIVVAFFDTAWLDPRQSKLRTLAAKVQEEFDCNVLQLPWNDALAGRHPSPEDIHEAAGEHTPSSAAPLENWYPRAVASLPLYEGRLIESSKRKNCFLISISSSFPRPLTKSIFRSSSPSISSRMKPKIRTSTGPQPHSR